MVCKRAKRPFRRTMSSGVKYGRKDHFTRVREINLKQITEYKDHFADEHSGLCKKSGRRSENYFFLFEYRFLYDRWYIFLLGTTKD